MVRAANVGRERIAKIPLFPVKRVEFGQFRIFSYFIRYFHPIRKSRENEAGKNWRKNGQSFIFPCNCFVFNSHRSEILVKIKRSNLHSSFDSLHFHKICRAMKTRIFKKSRPKRQMGELELTIFPRFLQILNESELKKLP